MINEKYEKQIFANFSSFLDIDLKANKKCVMTALALISALVVKDCSQISQ